MKRGYFTTGSRARLMKKEQSGSVRNFPQISLLDTRTAPSACDAKAAILHRFIKGNSGLNVPEAVIWECGKMIIFG